MTKTKFVGDEAALVKWLKESGTPDPLMEEIRKRAGVERGWGAFMSDPLLKHFQKVRKKEETMDELFEWIEDEKRKGHLHLIRMKPEGEEK